MMRATTLVLTIMVAAPAWPQDFPAGLRRYLNLADTQIAAIEQMNSDYQQAVLSARERASRLQSQIANLSRQDPEDPMAIGVRYADIETIHRDLTSQLNVLRGKLQASLTDAQQARLKTLDDARKLQPLAGEAICQNLLVSSAIFAFVSLAPTASIDNPSTPQNLPADLQQYLALSSGQADSINSLKTANQQRNDVRRQRIAQLQNEIVQETARDALDPLALGSRYVEIDTINRDINADTSALHGDVLAVLNDAQRSKLGALSDAQSLQPLINEAQRESLLESPSVSLPIFTRISGTATAVFDPSFSCNSPGLLFGVPLAIP